MKSYKEFILESMNIVSVKQAANEILEYLNDNGVFTWTQFVEDRSKFDIFVVNSLIDSYSDTKEDVDKIKFILRLELSDFNELKEMLKEYEQKEEYEKCRIIHNKIESYED